MDPLSKKAIQLDPLAKVDGRQHLMQQAAPVAKFVDPVGSATSRALGMSPRPPGTGTAQQGQR